MYVNVVRTLTQEKMTTVHAARKGSRDPQSMSIQRGDATARVDSRHVGDVKLSDSTSSTSVVETGTTMSIAFARNEQDGKSYLILYEYQVSMNRIGRFM